MCICNKQPCNLWYIYLLVVWTATCGDEGNSKQWVYLWLSNGRQTTFSKIKENMQISSMLCKDRDFNHKKYILKN